MSTTATVPAARTAVERITTTLKEQGWTITQLPSLIPGTASALRAELDDRCSMVVFFAGKGGDKPYGFEGYSDGTITRQGNIPWLVEHVEAFIRDEDTVLVQAEFAMLVDGEPMGTYDSPSELGVAVVAAYGSGAVRVEIVRAV